MQGVKGLKRVLKFRIVDVREMSRGSWLPEDELFRLFIRPRLMCLSSFQVSLNKPSVSGRLVLQFYKAKYLHSACDLNFHMACLWGDNPS